jgi:hypothetical protein
MTRTNVKQPDRYDFPPEVVVTPLEPADLERMLTVGGNCNKRVRKALDSAVKGFRYRRGGYNYGRLGWIPTRVFIILVSKRGALLGVKQRPYARQPKVGSRYYCKLCAESAECAAILERAGLLVTG